MASKVVTLFGGSGFIGRYLVRHLARQGHVLRVAVRHPARADFLKPLGDVGQITPIPASVTHEASVAQAVEGADAVVNFVGILYEKGKRSFQAVHVEGAQRVAAAAKTAGVGSLVQVSAIGADQNAPANYARSKAAGETAVLAAFPEATVVRPSIVIGPEDDFFNRFAAMTRLSPFLPLIGGGTTRFQPVYVGDVAEAIAKVLLTPGHGGRVYELGGPQVYSFKDLMVLLLQEIDRKRALVTLPSGLASLMAGFMELAPVPPLTRDQVKLLKVDNVVSPEALTFETLGMAPQAIEGILPTYLDKYRRGGRFSLQQRTN
ncbi:MAG: complex I NDUFA9 subunit family protein [Rhodospirillales bacterium]